MNRLPPGLRLTDHWLCTSFSPLTLRLYTSFVSVRFLVAQSSGQNHPIWVHFVLLRSSLCWLVFFCFPESYSYRSSCCIDSLCVLLIVKVPGLYFNRLETVVNPSPDALAINCSLVAASRNSTSYGQVGSQDSRLEPKATVQFLPQMSISIPTRFGCKGPVYGLRYRFRKVSRNRFRNSRD